MLIHEIRYINVGFLGLVHRSMVVAGEAGVNEAVAFVGDREITSHTILNVDPADYDFEQPNVTYFVTDKEKQ